MVLITLSITPMPVVAIDLGSGSTSAPVDPNLAAGRKAVDAKDWAKAVELLQLVVVKDAKNADGFNLLGYAFRHQGKYDDAFKAYGQALAIDPRHRGAHEYIGEAYLKVGDLPKAEAHLAELDRLCLFGCEEYRDLRKAIAEYKAGKSS